MAGDTPTAAAPPAVAPSDARLSGVAEGIRACLTRSPPDRHEALRWVVQFIALYEGAHHGRRAAMVADEPAFTGDARWDAMLAATAEHLCYHHGQAVPAWSADPRRFLDRWWFVSPHRSLHAGALVSSPAAFANRGVFLHSDSLASV